MFTKSTTINISMHDTSNLINEKHNDRGGKVIKKWYFKKSKDLRDNVIGLHIHSYIHFLGYGTMLWQAGLPTFWRQCSFHLQRGSRNTCTKIVRSPDYHNCSYPQKYKYTRLNNHTL